MATFPTIYVHSDGTLAHTPVVGEFESTMATDPAIRSVSESGYVQSRARFTRIRRRWTVKFDGVTKTNKNTIKTFEDARVGGADSFTWTNPEDSTAYTVRFLEPVMYKPWTNANFTRWTIDFVLEQV